MMPSLDTLHFLRPQAFWLLLGLPVLLAVWAWRRHRNTLWRQAVDAHLLPHLLAGEGRSGTLMYAGTLLAWGLAVTALAGPSWRQGEQPLWQMHHPLVIALDLSSASRAADLPPSRLLQVRDKLAHLLRERQGGQVALIVYAEDAYTVAPLTQDADNVALFLDALAPEIMPNDGQRADRAIAWSVRLLKQADFTQGQILLISDHADEAAWQAASTAAAQGYRVSALGVGTATGAAYRTGNDSFARASLNAASLQRLAVAGGGGFQVFSRDDTDLQALGVLQPEQAAPSPASSGHARIWQDQGYWLLPPLLLLALLAFRRGAARWLLASACLMWTLPAPAAEGSWWRRADQQGYDRMAQGVQAYRNGDYAKAEHAFSGQDSALAHYNLGNALARQGRYDQAIRAYDEALRRQPGMPDAIANRAAVQQARQRQQAPAQNPPGASSSPQSSSGSTSRAAPSQNAPAPSGRSDASAPTQPPETPTTSADPKRQQAANAAQRERMQQALSGTPQEQVNDSKTTQAAAEQSPQARERQQAMQAWLKRIPDDPGGLLKARFQREHQRRMREGQ